MTPSDLEELKLRVQRLRARLEQKEGSGFSQSHTFENGETHNYKVNGVKPIEEFEDDLLGIFVWLWSAKDYLKEIARSNGKSPQEIENIVNREKSLQYVADIANRSKHGVLNQSRSGEFAELANVGISIPQHAMKSLVFGAFDVTTNVSKPEFVEYSANVVVSGGRKVCTAQELIQSTLLLWEAHAEPYVAGT